MSAWEAWVSRGIIAKMETSEPNRGLESEAGVQVVPWPPEQGEATFEVSGEGSEQHLRDVESSENLTRSQEGLKSP